MFLVAPYAAICQVVEDIDQTFDQYPDDTAKVNRLIKLGEKYCAKDNQKALFYLQESLNLSNQLDYKYGISWSYLWMGRVYYYMDEYELARTSLYKSKKLLDTVDDPFGLVFYYFGLGSISHLKLDYVNAIKEFQQVEYYSRLAGNKLYESAGTFALGTIQYHRGVYGEAKKYILQSLKTKIEIDDRKGIANAYNTLGNLYKALEQYDSAMYNFKLGYDIRKARGDDRAIANSLVPMAQVDIFRKDYSAAIKKLNQARNIYLALDEKTGVCLVDNELARAAFFLGKKDEAEHIIESTLQNARQLNNTSMVLNCLTTMAEMQAESKNYQVAYQLGLRIAKLRDSLNNANREEVIQEMEARYKLEQKNSEIEILSNQNSIQHKNIILLSVSIGALVLILILVAVLFRINARAHQRHKKLLEQEKTILEQEEKIKQKEMQLLQENVESKNRELASKAIEMLRINETIGEVISKLESMNKIHAGDPAISSHTREIARELENQTNTNTWKEFDKIFKNIHTEFYNNLLNACPTLTASEIKIAALLKLNLSTKEIAAITYKSEEGIKSTRYRLRKKLDLTGDDKLVSFLMKL
jgi:tetratricopeptide (TPR) repeat protein/DNA-binding CsgD family transcriptional regulator